MSEYERKLEKQLEPFFPTGDRSPKPPLPEGGVVTALNLFQKELDERDGIVRYYKETNDMAQRARSDAQQQYANLIKKVNETNSCFQAFQRRFEELREYLRSAKQIKAYEDTHLWLEKTRNSLR